VYAARRERWALAAALGALAAGTRVTGVLLVAIALLGPARSRLKLSQLRADRRRLWLALIPAGVISYLAFLTARGYGPLAPFRGESSAQYGRHFVGPLVAVWDALAAAVRGAVRIVTGSEPALLPHSLAGPFAPGAESIYLIAVLALAAFALVATFRRLPLAYGVYALLALLVALASPVAAQPLKSLDRYLLTIFPLWMAVGAWVAEKRLLWPVAAVSAALLAFFAMQFASWTFVA
jgi:hypothetical protein